MLGIGTDIIEIRRVQRSVNRFRERFLKKIFTEEELLYCFSLQNPFPSLAVRFSAKEAVAKAVGTGISKELTWRDIEIQKAKGKPIIRLRRKFLIHGKTPEFHLSLSHSKEYAIATAIAFIAL
ncbi:holo-ACP synthase [Chlamydiifrater volucris]|uniref:holo-ACP synthase n=1 Tax=Chlamydiifrater volucris TaxID=2681470 RepID=UPI001BCC4BB3|nr:holo-ACP synthase [Chlamydiifrater volucris]